jgi:hypothetical protein
MFIAHGSLFRLKLGLAVAAALTLVMAVRGLHKGVIMWVGIVFFTFASVAVLGFEHVWTMRHMGILAHGALAIGAWITLALGRPFTLEYAREHVAPALWNDPVFLRTNVFMTTVWAVVFTLGAGLAWAKMQVVVEPEWLFDAANYTLMVSCVAFTSWYPAVARRKAQAARAR